MSIEAPDFWRCVTPACSGDLGAVGKTRFLRSVELTEQVIDKLLPFSDAALLDQRDPAFGKIRTPRPLGS